MMFGIAFQVATLFVFGFLAIDFSLRIRKQSGAINGSTTTLRSSKKFKGVLGALIVAYSTILLRCIYRIAEMYVLSRRDFNCDNL